MTCLVPPPSTSGKSLMERVEDALLPLINLVFLLLMFFIAAGQISDDPLPDLPVSSASEQNETPHADMTVTADGSWRIAGQMVAGDVLFEKLPTPDDQHPLKIAAATSITMAELETLFYKLERRGYEEIILLTEPVL
jgi:biopolymer transport protein ExbD